MRLSSLLSPACLLIALLMLIAGFAMVAVDPPTESVQLHAARASGDELTVDAWNQRLLSQIWFRRLLMAALFCGSILMALLSFMTMRGKP